MNTEEHDVDENTQTELDERMNVSKEIFEASPGRYERCEYFGDGLYCKLIGNGWIRVR